MLARGRPRPRPDPRPPRRIGYAPENTLAAFKLAVEQRADWLEMDVQQTNDGQLVVFHDLRMERTTNGRGALRDLTLDQVRELDAGTWFGAKFAGERVPTFEEVVALAREHGIRIFPEVKDPRLYPGIEERVAAVIVRQRLRRSHRRAVVRRGVARDGCGRINPKLRLAALYTAADPLRGEPPAGAEIIGPPWELVVDRPRPRARRSRLWPTGRRLDRDGRTGMQQMLDARVDGIITGRPDIVRSLLDAQ